MTLLGLFSVSKSRINDSCTEDEAIRVLINSGDPGLQAVGVRRMLEKYGAENISDEVRKMLLETSKPKNCEVVDVKTGPDGKKQMLLGNCR